MQVTGLARSTLYNKCSRDEIPHHKKGKLYFSKKELQEWMNSESRDIDVTEYLK
jgi:predicted DNA-binding transcriptional regulator AlpA